MEEKSLGKKTVKEKQMESMSVFFPRGLLSLQQHLGFIKCRAFQQINTDEPTQPFDKNIEYQHLFSQLLLSITAMFDFP